VDAASATLRTRAALVDVGAQSPVLRGRTRRGRWLLARLLRPSLVVVVPQSATDPCGRYVEQLWRREGMLGDVLAKQARGELLRSVGSGDLPGYLLDGRAQAGMFYLSEARQLDPVRVQTLELPPTDDLRERIRFVVAALGARGEPFARFLLGPEAQSILRAAGFITRRP
jgi:ABC-type molybdate transport system substrate-binding protein